MTLLKRPSFVLIIALYLMAANSAFAKGLIRDAEIESDLRAISAPLFEAAGLNPARVKIVLINDDNVNAFVAGGQNLFIYTGMILEAKTVGELSGVIAHEAGHMAGGHLIRMRGAAERASLESMAATVLGIAVGVGAGDANAGVATVMGGGEYANRVMLRNSRVFESSADQAGMAAIERAGYSTRGMASFLERLAGQEVLPELQRSGYVLTHPLSRERLATVESFVTRSRNKDKKWPDELENKFRMVQAKLLAFTNPARAQRQYESQNNTDAYYATAIAAYRQGRIDEALQKLAVLEKGDAKNPWFKELRGQIYLEQGRIPQAVAAYRQAVALSPQSGLIHLALAQALLQNETQKPDEALRELNAARDNGEEDTPGVYRWMAISYGRQGREDLAKLSLAEEALLKGDYNFAITQAKSAEALLAKDPAARQRARDIQSAAMRSMSERKNSKG